jgi:glucose-6-phosphate 1-dehydrogenase
MTKPPTSRPDHPQFAFVLFGGTGDLAMRKILPALCAAHRDGMLAPGGKIVSVALTALDTSSYLRWVDEHAKPYVLAAAIDNSVWRSFLERITYVELKASQPEAFSLLADTLATVRGRPIFYLATGPALFVPICRALASAGLTEGSRVVLEKPLGYDLESSNATNDAVGQIFKEGFCRNRAFC